MGIGNCAIIPNMEASMKDNQAVFGIEIDFQKNTASPSRVFKTMSELIDSFEKLDKDLIGSIDPRIKPVALIEDIEAGSIKAWLKYVFESIPDEGLKELDLKKVLGKYLVKAKYLIINFCNEKTTISDKKCFRQGHLAV